MSKYYMFHGLPGSGKSTLAEKIAQHFETKGIPYVKINRDNLRTELMGEEYHKGLPVSSVELQINDLVQKMIDDAILHNLVIIDDNTNLVTKAIRVTKEKLNKAGYSLIHIPVDIPIEVVKFRNQSRAEQGGRFVRESSIDRMHQRSYSGKEPKLDRGRLLMDGDTVFDIEDIMLYF